jgi:FkbM family methyltransferase
MSSNVKSSKPWLALRGTLHAALRARHLVAVNVENTVDARRVKVLRSRGVGTLLDIGANKGQYATLLRRHGFSGHIHSYEPVSGPFAVLSGAAARDYRWDVHQVAVSDVPGELVMHVAQNTSHSSALPVRSGYVAVTKASHVVAEETVRATTLDELAADVAKNFAIKIDVQGLEARVLDGGAAALARAEVLEMELNLINSYEGETLAPGLLERVFDMGFRLALVDNIGVDAEGGAIAFNGLFVRS